MPCIDILQLDINTYGNKWFKLYHQLKEAKSQQKTHLVTFGGAYSNHIEATAALGKDYGFKTIGMIRGEELGEDLEQTLNTNPTLRSAYNNGMRFKFIERSTYRNKHTSAFQNNLKKDFPNAYIIPEGGTNTLAVKGCQKIIESQHLTYDYIAVPVGTGGTISGIINAATSQQTILGFPALKGDFLNSEIKKYTSKTNWKLIKDYHFGGYAKINKELVEFINKYSAETNILLDPIYTGKMLFGLTDLIKNGYFPQNSRILAIHTGGLQGIAGINHKLKRKGLPLINIPQ